MRLSFLTSLKPFRNELAQIGLYTNASNSVVGSNQGRNEEVKGGTIPRAPNHYGGAEPLRRALKRPNNVASTFFNSTLDSERL